MDKTVWHIQDGIANTHCICAKIHKKEIYGKLKSDLGKILRELCQWKRVTIIEAHACTNHIHIYVEIPPKLSVSGFVGFLKGKGALFGLSDTQTKISMVKNTAAM